MVLLLLVFGAFSAWSPRRGLLVLKLAGARVELIHPPSEVNLFGETSLLPKLPAPYNQTLNWLGTDTDVVVIGLVNVASPEKLLPYLPRFPNAKTLVLKEPLPQDALRSAFQTARIQRVFIVGDNQAVHLDGLQTLVTLQELKLNGITSLQMSQDTIVALSRLRRIDVYDSSLSPEFFDQIGQLQEFSGTLAFSRCSGIDVEGLKRLARLVHLTRLEINRCDGIGGREVEALTQFTHLRFLRLHDTLVSEEAIQELRLAIPNCEID